MSLGQFEASEASEVEESTSAAGGGSTAIRGRSPWQLARARFRRDKVSMVALVVTVLFVLLGIAAPILVRAGVLDPYGQHQSLLGGLGSLPTGPFGGASLQHPLGVEPGTGRDLLARIVYGLASSLFIGAVATAFSIIIGTVVGIIAGFSGGWIDTALGRLMDLVLAFPQLLMLLALSIVVIDRLVAMGIPSGNPSHFTYVILVLGIFGWPYFARIIRGQVLSIRRREFVEAAESLGARGPRIWFTEILPNIWAPILVYVSLLLPQYIAAEAALAFLGVSVQPPTPTLGNVLTDSVNYAGVDPIFFWAPGAMLVLLVLAFNLLGDGLRDALDPKTDRH
ncbi:MAG TPA: ABC transporter permease [Segeticoccus sp.]|uniref:ABC transporter permease n=1 Tax=Segeticoccus sp. TaxID=2706531 RepID=UPI002D7F99BD|nr:ABC transporter permease [Segeticoccus sp.]HET8599865.1 ABC transporter permease [Segeticoccus sp.]